MNWFQKLLSNPFLLIGLSSWFWAQLIKTIIHAIVTKSIDFTRLIGDGGMPSGHSATVSSLATAAALVYGLGSFEFAMAFIFAIVVCKEYQNRHIGRRCVLDMLKLAKAQGMDAVKANIYSFNTQSQNMFLSVGFEKTDEEWYCCKLDQ